jgi:flagellar biosynthesis/type III secretory pathway protein FliH
MTPEVRDDRHMQALTGLSNENLTILEEVFSETYQEKKQQAYQEGFAEGKCQRKAGGGQKGKLPTAHDKLIFLLSYLKVHPTF